MFKKLRKIHVKFFDILLIISVIIIGISVYAVLNRTTQYITVVIKVGDQNVHDSYYQQGVQDWFAHAFYPGMAIGNPKSYPLALVSDVREYDLTSEQKAVYLTIKLQTLYSPSTKQYLFNGKNVLVGSTIDLDLNNVYVNGTVVEIKGISKPYQNVKLKIDSQIINIHNYAQRFSGTNGVLPYIPDNINVGDSITDFDGNTILEVTNKTVEDAKKVITTSNGDALLGRDPLLKDVYLTVQVSGYKLGNRYFFFGNIPLSVDEQLPMHFSKISIYPIITHIEEIK